MQADLAVWCDSQRRHLGHADIGRFEAENGDATVATEIKDLEIIARRIECIKQTQTIAAKADHFAQLSRI